MVEGFFRFQVLLIGEVRWHRGLCRARSGPPPQPVRCAAFFVLRLSDRFALRRLDVLVGAGHEAERVCSR